MIGKIKISGKVTIQVFDCNGKVKRRSPEILRRLLGLQGEFLIQEFHNIVTREGDALLAYQNKSNQHKRLYSDWHRVDRE
jgi:hypothetical protein